MSTAALVGPPEVGATVSSPGLSSPAPPSVAAWGFGVAPPDYTGVTIWVAPHPDDEGGLWADELNTGATSFPVFVFLTNGENAGACTDDTSLQAAPEGNLASGDRPPFNTAAVGPV